MKDMKLKIQRMGLTSEQIAVGKESVNLNYKAINII